MTRLSSKEVRVVVNLYIGVSEGYLGDFSYRTHAEFYPEYCDLDIDPHDLDGTTRERFIQILSTAHPHQQAKILRGVIERFSVEAEDAPSTRTADLRARIEEIAARLEGGPEIPTPSLPAQAEAVRRALADAENLIGMSGATSAVDRVHTALHAYLQAVCADAGLELRDDASLTVLFKAARQGHPALSPDGPRSGDIDKILRSFAAVLDALGPLRNKASMAHPQPCLLGQPEAMLVVHATRTVMHYLVARLASAPDNNGRAQETTP